MRVKYGLIAQGVKVVPTASAERVLPDTLTGGVWKVILKNDDADETANGNTKAIYIGATDTILADESCPALRPNEFMYLGGAEVGMSHPLDTIDPDSLFCIAATAAQVLSYWVYGVVSHTP